MKGKEVASHKVAISHQGSGREKTTQLLTLSSIDYSCYVNSKEMEAVKILSQKNEKMREAL